MATNGPVSFGSSRAEVAATRLAELIEASENGLRLGTKEEVAARLDVSLGTFNETLRLLQARGLVSVRPGPGGGVFTAQQPPMARLGHAMLGLNIDRVVIAEAVRIRNALEYLVVEDACRYANETDLSLMDESLEDMAASLTDEDGIAFLHANWELHSRIARAAGSDMLRSLYSSLLDLVESHTISVRSAGPISLTEFHQERLQVHQELVDAIRAGDIGASALAIDHHNEGLGGEARVRHSTHRRQGG